MLSRKTLSCVLLKSVRNLETDLLRVCIDPITPTRSFEDVFVPQAVSERMNITLAFCETKSSLSYSSIGYTETISRIFSSLYE